MKHTETLPETIPEAAAASGLPVRLRHVRKAFGRTEVLADINLDVHPEEHVVILGKSGQGKSVTIKCIIGLLQADSGTITVLGRNIEELEYEELKELRTKVGFLFQGGALYDSMSVRHNLEFPLMRVLKIKDRKVLRERVDEALEDIGLPGIAAKMPSSLSGGQRKRVALARSLILKPELMLYDEPTTGLDPITSREISNLIMEMRQKYHITSIIITHDMPCAHITADRLLVLNEGRFIAEGTYSELEHATDALVRSFFK
jgi:phospholipid/cholesterol/gamma-HCH transport system ATP-binding protein